MILDILPLAGGTARLVRVYGGEPCVKLPGAVPAPEGEGQWPITELGDYCFSEKPRGLPGPEKTCRYERAEDGKLCLTRAFGRDVGGLFHRSSRFCSRRSLGGCLLVVHGVKDLALQRDDGHQQDEDQKHQHHTGYGNDHIIT